MVSSKTNPSTCRCLAQTESSAVNALLTALTVLHRKDAHRRIEPIAASVIKPTILLTNQYAPQVLELIAGEAGSDFRLISFERPTHSDIVTNVPHADYLLVGGRIPIDIKVLDAAVRLQMVQRTGVGLDSMDLDAARARGIPVYLNPGVNAQSVAEHTLLLMLAALRRLPTVHETVRTGRWQKHELGIRNRDLCGRRVALVGMGHIGRAVARLLQPFDVSLRYYRPTRLPVDDERTLGLKYQVLDELIEDADVLSLHCPLNDETRGLLSRDRIARMKVGSVVINTARGGLVDEAALIEALCSDRLGAAALDVFAQEPMAPDNPLRRLDNVVLTPHLGGITFDSFLRMMQKAFHNIRCFEAGKFDAIAELRLH